MFPRRIKSVLAILALMSPFYASASGASLHLTASKTTVSPGETFSVSVLVSSETEAMNAASGVLSFPKDKLEATSIQKGGLFNFWLKEPGYSNQLGTANFEGIVLNPGFKGKAGKILTVGFRAKAAGSAQVALSSGEVLANDGKGTNILSGLGKISIGIKEAAAAPSVPASPVTETAAKPLGGRLEISSSTHPDAFRWYPDRDFRIEWASEGVTDISVVLDGKPDTVPPRKAGLAGHFEAKGLPDGLHYFHLAYRDKNGWQKPMHSSFRIDATPPEHLSLDFAEGKETFSPPRTSIGASDAASGIHEYKLKVGGQDWISISKESAGEAFLLPIVSPGKQSVVLEAYDQAGNRASISDEVDIKAIKEPSLDGLDEAISREDYLRVSGTAGKGGSVTVWIAGQGAEPRASKVRANDAGRFFFIADRLETGWYELWAQAEDGRGAKSNLTARRVFEVKEPFISKDAAQILMLASLFFLLVLAAFSKEIFSYVFRLFKREWKLMRGGGLPKPAGITNAYAILHDNITRQIRHLEKIEAEMGLMEKEERTLIRLKEEVKNIEKYIKGK